MVGYVKKGASIPQAVITGSLDSAFDQFDSADPTLHLIQLVDAVVSIEPWKSQNYYYYYDSVGQLPEQDSALEGMVALVNRIDLPRETALYVNTSKEWKLLQKYDSSRETFQGETASFVAGGLTSPNIIERWPHASEGTATNVGSLLYNRGSNPFAHGVSPTHGYSAYGGSTDAAFRVDRFPMINPFTTATSAGDLSNLPAAKFGPNANTAPAVGVSSEYYGFFYSVPSGNPFYLQHNIKYLFSSNTSAQIHGDYDVRSPGNGIEAQGINSVKTGYFTGGSKNGTISSIYSFPFQTETPIQATPATLSIARYYGGGVSSPSYGYTTGGQTVPAPAPNFRNTIDRFPFASLAPATDMGDLNIARRSQAATSGSTHGYNFGGVTATAPSVLIDKFPYSAPFVTATDVGDIGAATSGQRGFQI